MFLLHSEGTNSFTFEPPTPVPIFSFQMGGLYPLRTEPNTHFDISEHDDHILYEDPLLITE